LPVGYLDSRSGGRAAGPAGTDARRTIATWPLLTALEVRPVVVAFGRYRPAALSRYAYLRTVAVRDHGGAAAVRAAQRTRTPGPRGGIPVVRMPGAPLTATGG